MSDIYPRTACADINVVFVRLFRLITTQRWRVSTRGVSRHPRQIKISPRQDHGRRGTLTHELKYGMNFTPREKYRYSR